MGATSWSRIASSSTPASGVVSLSSFLMVLCIGFTSTKLAVLSSLWIESSDSSNLPLKHEAMIWQMLLMNMKCISSLASNSMVYGGLLGELQKRLPLSSL